MPPAPTDPAGPGTWWRCRVLGADGSLRWFTFVADDRYPDLTTVEMSEAQAAELVGEAAECVARFDDEGRVRRLDGGYRFSKDARALWFAEVSDRRANPPAMNLLAFTGHGVAPGTLVTREEWAEAGVGSADQIAAVRWIPETGQAHQIYVQPEWRRCGIATGVGVAAATLLAARGGPRVWGDGNRTALGERWRDGTDWAHLASDLEYLEAPMTPFDQR